MNISPWYLILVGLAAVIGELIVGVETGFDLLLLGLALIVGGTVGLWTGQFEIGLLATIILAVLYILFGRAFIKKRLLLTTSKTNAEQVIDQEGIVVKELSSKTPGQVKVEGEVWRAVLSDSTIDTVGKGEKIKVDGVTGVTLRVTLVA